jgi:PAS domain-containing protein
MSELDKIENLTHTLIKVEDNLKYEYKVLQQIVDLNSDGYWDWDLQKNYKYLSSKIITKLGYTKENIESCEDYWKTICNPNDTDICENILNDLMNNITDSINTTIRFYKKDGIEIKLQIKGKVIEYDKNKLPKRAIGVFNIV